MAKSLDQHRNDRVRSIKGRLLGITNDSFLVGQKDMKRVITNATSDTTGTTIPGHGVHTVVTTTNDGWLLGNPTEGVPVTLATNSTSTGTHAITFETTATTVVSSNGVAGSSITMYGVGSYFTLIGISTGQYLMTSRYVSSAGSVTVTVSS